MVNKRTRLYLDWNVVSKLQRAEKEASKDTFRSILELLRRRKGDFELVYSDAHLEDLKKSYDQGQYDLVDDDLDFLQRITSENHISLDSTTKEISYHFYSIDTRFNEIVGRDDFKMDSLEDFLETCSGLGLPKFFESFKNMKHNINVEEIEKINPLLASMFPHSREDKSYYAAIQDVFYIFNRIKTDPEAYNELRRLIKSGLGVDSNIGNALNVIDTFNKILPNTEMGKSFTQMHTDSNEKNIKDNDVMSLFITKYMQLDMLGYKSDKLTEKNLYMNVITDAKHSYFASHCEIYVSDDKKNRKKSEQVYLDDDIKTMVLSPREFLEYLNEMRA